MGCGGRGSVERVDVVAGRALACERSRARGRTMLARTAKSCGPDASTPASSLWWATSASDGDKKARSPGRARNKLLKPSRAGMPGDPGATVVTNACAFYHCARGYGCNGHPAFPAPPLGWRHALIGAEGFMHQLGRIARRERKYAPEIEAPSLRANGSRECAPDDRLRKGNQSGRKARMDCFVASLLAMTIYKQTVGGSLKIESIITSPRAIPPPRATARRDVRGGKSRDGRFSTYRRRPASPSGSRASPP
jgi:hypothetical protein